MYFCQSLLLICILLILTERVHSQTLRGPGISSCSYADFRNSECGWAEILVSDIPKECTSLNFLVAMVDENFCVGPGDSYADYNILDILLDSDKDVYLYYGRPSQTDWAKMLVNGSVEANSLKEMDGLKVFLDKHPGIAGLILCGLHYDPGQEEFPNYTENFKIYLEVLKKTYPSMIIGLDLFGAYLIDQYTNPWPKWLDFKVLDIDIDFYAVTLEYFNACDAQLKSTGIVPKSGTKEKYNTLDTLKDVLQKISIPKEKTYFKFKTNPETPSEDDGLTLCNMNNEKLCVLPSISTFFWCSDTISSYNEKGQFSQENGAGFIARYINFEDKNNTCKCKKPFFAFYALLDGFNGISSEPCKLFDNRNN